LKFSEGVDSSSGFGEWFGKFCPFEWKAGASQRLLAEDAVVMQQMRGFLKIGVSLLKTSFPLAQSGDSVGYDKNFGIDFGKSFSLK